MHDERSEECIIHEPIEQHELTHLHHGSVIFGNNSDLWPIHLVNFFHWSGGSIHSPFCGEV